MANKYLKIILPACLAMSACVTRQGDSLPDLKVPNEAKNIVRLAPNDFEASIDFDLTTEENSKKYALDLSDQLKRKGFDSCDLSDADWQPHPGEKVNPALDKWMVLPLIDRNKNIFAILRVEQMKGIPPLKQHYNIAMQKYTESEKNSEVIREFCEL
ncbi:MAG: hypothetical protein ACREO1_16260 [Arenimonas sp.]